MSHDELGQLLLSLEGEHLEFKEAREGFSFEELTKYCAAIANEGGGRVVLGVSNARPRRIVGTRAFPQIERTRSSLMDKVRLRIDVEELERFGARVLLFRVPPRPVGVPIRVDGVYWARRADSLVPMEEEQLRQVFGELGHDLSADPVPGVGIQDLDERAVGEFRRRWMAKSGNAKLLDLPVEQLLADAEALVDGGVTLAALVLFGTRGALRRHLAQAEVVFEYRSSETAGPAQQRKEYQEAFFSYYEDLWNTVNLRNDVQNYRDGLFVLDIPTFDERSIREAVLNAVSHRDYRLGGSVFIRQYPRRIEVESPGGFPPGISEQNVLDRQYPRNRRIADVFAKCGLVERSGQGMNLMFETALRQAKAQPVFTGTDAFQVKLTLEGEVSDPAFVRFVERAGAESPTPFSTSDLTVLDLIRRGRPIPAPLEGRVSVLVDNGIVERISRSKGRRYLLSRRFHQFLGESGVYTRKRGLDRDTNKELLCKHIADNARMGAQMDSLRQVLPHLSRSQIQVLLRELTKAGRVHHHGATRAARWYPGPETPDCNHTGA